MLSFSREASSGEADPGGSSPESSFSARLCEGLEIRLDIPGSLRPETGSRACPERSIPLLCIGDRGQPERAAGSRRGVGGETLEQGASTPIRDLQGRAFVRGWSACECPRSYGMALPLRWSSADLLHSGGTGPSARSRGGRSPRTGSYSPKNLPSSQATLCSMMTWNWWFRSAISCCQKFSLPQSGWFARKS